jgi:hypothetical protein
MGKNGVITQFPLLGTEVVQAPEPYLVVEGNGIRSQGFTNDEISPEQQDIVDEATRVIHTYMERIGTDILEIGRQLTRVKAILAHGQFLQWVEQEFGLKERTAERWMTVYLRLGDQADLFRQLKPTALYSVAMPSTPAAAIAIVAEKLRAGERLSVQEVLTIIATWKRPAPSDDEQPDIIAAQLAKDLRKAGAALSQRTVEACAWFLGEAFAERLAQVRTELDSLRDQVQSRLSQDCPSAAEAWMVVSEPAPPVPTQVVGARVAVPQLPGAAQGQTFDDSAAAERIVPGCTVLVQEAETSQGACYTLVTDEPGQPDGGRIHWDSPVARALRYQRVGEIVTAQTPDGPLRLAITGVRWPDGRLAGAWEATPGEAYPAADAAFS